MAAQTNATTSSAREKEPRGRRLLPWVISLLVHVLLIALTALVVWSVRVAPGGGEGYRLGMRGGGGATGTRRPAGRAEDALTRAQAAEAERASTTELVESALAETPIVPRTQAELLDHPPAGGPGTRTGAPGIPALGEGGGRGEGRGPGFGPGFGEHIGRLRARGFDVVFVYDSTKSMEPFIGEVKTRIRDLVRVITHLVPGARVGLVAYKDYGDIFEGRGQPLTTDVSLLQRFLDDVPITGGGDEPEAVMSGLREAINRNPWGRRAHKVIVLFGDAPPHPTEEDEAKHRVRLFHRDGGIVSVIDARLLGGEAEQAVMPIFREIAQAGGGEALKVSQEAELVRYLLILAFGSEWTYDLEQVYEQVLGKELPGKE